MYITCSRLVMDSRVRILMQFSGGKVQRRIAQDRQKQSPVKRAYILKSNKVIMVYNGI